MKKSKMYEIGIEIFLEEEAHWESMRRAVCSGALAPPEWMDSEMMELFSEGRDKELKKRIKKRKRHAEHHY